MNDYTEFLQKIVSGVDLSEAQRWADLGCGSGVFTEALANCLAGGSEVIGVDQRSQRLAVDVGNGVEISFLNADFERDVLDLPLLDGILMANALHFVKDKSKLIQKLEKLFVSSPRFVIVEYETTQANPWVPFPISFAELKELFGRLDYRYTERIATRKSAYGGEMYGAVVDRKIEN